MTETPDSIHWPPDPCWILRSPDKENPLKDEVYGAVMAFSTQELATAFGTEIVGAGNFVTEEWCWSDLKVRGRIGGFTGAIFDHVEGNARKIIARFIDY